MLSPTAIKIPAEQLCLPVLLAKAALKPHGKVVT